VSTDNQPAILTKSKSSVTKPHTEEMRPSRTVPEVPEGNQSVN
jgi:hypothetical protein